MAVASVVAAAAGYLVMLVATRSLGKIGSADFLAYWSLLFMIFGVLSGIQNEVTRAVGATLITPSTPGIGTRSARALPWALGVGAVLGLLLLSTSPLWAASLLPDNTTVLVIILSLAAVLFSGQAAVTGAVAGRRQWPLYATLISLDAVARLAVAVAVAVLTHSLWGIEAACAAGTLVWVVALLVSRDTRSAAGAYADVPAPRLLRNYGHAILTTASSSVLVVGFPILLRATTSVEDYQLAAPLVLAISLTRAPIMIPLQAFQGVAISAFMRSTSHRLGALVKPVVLLTGIGVVGGIAAVFIGPPIMSIFGAGFGDISGLLLGVLTLDAVLMAILTLTGTALLALGRHGSYSLGWVVAAVLSVLLLLLPGTVETRAAVSLSVGPVLGIITHIVAIVLTRPAASADDGAETSESTEQTPL
ncbi:hypothetical protein GCM10022198_09940 [Klugiella xanthotipulae]